MIHRPPSAVLLVSSAMLLALVPEPALACMVCGEATEETQAALLTSTIVLSLLPLGLIFGGMFAVWNAAGRPTFEEPDAGAP